MRQHWQQSQWIAPVWPALPVLPAPMPPLLQEIRIYVSWLKKKHRKTGSSVASCEDMCRKPLQSHEFCRSTCRVSRVPGKRDIYLRALQYIVYTYQTCEVLVFCLLFKHNGYRWCLAILWTLPLPRNAGWTPLYADAARQLPAVELFRLAL